MKKYIITFLSIIVSVSTSASQGALKGEFSISSTKKIHFSQGNLQYQATTNVWRFANNQYDFIGYPNVNISSTYSGWIDLLSWGSSGYGVPSPTLVHKTDSYGSSNYQQWFIGGSSSKSIAGTNYDWGVYNAIENGGNASNLWRTLTYDEWKYLIFSRPNAASKYGLGSINGTKGLVILPDIWVQPDGCSFYAGVDNTKLQDYWVTYNKYTINDWKKMEDAGAVFLPASGERGNMSYNSGIYWSSSACPSSVTSMYYLYAGILIFRYDYGTNKCVVYCDYTYGDCRRYEGSAIRLVQDNSVYDTQTKWSVTGTANSVSYGAVNGGGIYSNNTIATLTAVANKCYQFIQWSDGNTNNPRTITVSSDTIFMAEFAPIQYTISTSATNGTITGSGIYDCNATATLTATPNEHYHFVKWSDGNTSNPRTITVTKDSTFTAVFALDQFTITATGEHGTVIGSGTYNYGAKATLTATNSDCYSFQKWSDGNTDNPRSVVVTQDSTFTAIFVGTGYQETVKCTVVNESPYGTVSFTGTVIKDSNISLKATAPECSKFVKWLDGDTSNPRSLTITQDSTLTAIFEKIQFNIILETEDESKGEVDGE